MMIALVRKVENKGAIQSYDGTRAHDYKGQLQVTNDYIKKMSKNKEKKEFGTSHLLSYPRPKTELS